MRSVLADSSNSARGVPCIVVVVSSPWLVAVTVRREAHGLLPDVPRPRVRLSGRAGRGLRWGTSPRARVDVTMTLGIATAAPRLRGRPNVHCFL